MNGIIITAIICATIFAVFITDRILERSDRK